jgi:hypothetical protein
MNLPVEERFWRFVSPCPNTGCWWWTGAIQRKGYGHIGLGGRGSGNIIATRLSYRMRYGIDPGKLFVCHRCDSPGCVNPEHLFLSDNAGNMADCKRKGRARGPAFKGEAHGNAKLTQHAVEHIRSSRDTGVSLAKLYGVSPQCISMVRKHRVWRVS